MEIPTDTIVAIATPPGRGGVGILRISGPLAYLIGVSLSSLDTLTPRMAQYVSFYSTNEELLDSGLLLYFKAPHSFTGDDVVEFQVHGSPVVLDRLLNEIVSSGARLARPGEFSERAFLNEKIDLVQAEAIADLISASSVTAARMAVRSLQGDFSKQIDLISEQLIHLRLYVEASIDFPEEEIDFLNDGHIALEFNKIEQSLQNIRAKASQGAMLREGLSVVIAGLPNAGKSTLINQLAGRDVAIVTEIAGTTRDVMREAILLDDLPLHLIDTAGLRDSDCLVEKEGIKRAWQEVSRADCLLLVKDVNSINDSEAVLSEKILATLPPEVPIIYVMNKIDTLSLANKNKLDAIYISAKSGEGLELLKAEIKSRVGYQPLEGQFLARRRHLLALDNALNCLIKGRDALINQRALELLAEDLRQAHLALCEITGEFSSDDLLGKIFSSFCIGK